jgi:hypothetical protein
MNMFGSCDVWSICTSLVGMGDSYEIIANENIWNLSNSWIKSYHAEPTLNVYSGRMRHNQTKSVNMSRTIPKFKKISEKKNHQHIICFWILWYLQQVIPLVSSRSWSGCATPWWYRWCLCRTMTCYESWSKSNWDRGRVGLSWVIRTWWIRMVYSCDMFMKLWFWKPSSNQMWQWKMPIDWWFSQLETSICRKILFLCLSTRG